MDGLDSLDLGRAKIGYAGVPNLPFLHESGDLGPGFLQICLRIRPVDLIEINHVYAETPQAVLALGANTGALEPWEDLSGRGIVPDKTAFRRYDHSVALTSNSPANDRLRVPQSVGRSRVDPIDAQIQRSLDRSQ
jgi:hypothetical protein